MSRLQRESNVIVCNVLDFIAESVNIYNLHLLRVSNPDFIMYDVTSTTKNNLFDTIMRNEDNTHIMKMLKLTLKSLHIIFDLDGYEFVSLADMFANYIQERQKKLQETGDYIEVETLLKSEIHSNSNVTPDLYLELCDIENRNIDLNLNYDTHARSILYNTIDDSSYDVINYSSNSFEDDDYLVELELLYYEDPISIIKFRVSHTKVQSFECPICYEIPKSPNFCITLSCNHKYCENCFQDILDSNTILCAMCRCPITECEKSEII